MFKVYKCLFLILFICLIVCQKVNASDAYFVWEKTTIDVPINSPLENYKNDYKVSFYVDGKKSTDFTIEKEVNCSTFSTVLTNKIGKYTVYYKAKSEKYYVSSTQPIIFNVIDVTVPKINQISNVNIECGTTIDIDKYFSFSDDTCKNEELTIILDDSNIIYNTVGVYDASIIVLDIYNNRAVKEFKVNVKDTVKPQILIQKPLILSYGVPFVLEEYLIATDNCNGDLTKLIDIKGLDINKLGMQNVELSVSDYSNNVCSIKVAVNVIDDIPPSILLKYSEVVLDVENFDKYDNDFFEQYILDVSDNETTKEGLKIEIDFTTLKKQIGDYKIKYLITDNSGLSSSEYLNIKIREMEGPKLVGNDIFTIKIGEEIDLLSLVEVVDEYDNKAKGRLEIASTNFNNNIVGDYEVTYICYNDSGCYSTKVVVIKVIDDVIIEEVTKDEINKEDFIEKIDGEETEGDRSIIDEFFTNEESLMKVVLGILLLILLVVLLKKRK